MSAFFICYMLIFDCFANRFTHLDDYGWFVKTLTRVVNEELGEEMGQITEKTEYYVDFLR